MKFDRRFWTRAAIWVGIAGAVYVGNWQLQSFLGRRALADTGLVVRTLDEGLIAAQAQRKPVLVAYSAIWCPSCRTLDKAVLADEAVNAMVRDEFVFVRVEVDSDVGRELRDRFHLEGFPHVLVLSADGSLVEHLPRTYDPSEFMDEARRSISAL